MGYGTTSSAYHCVCPFHVKAKRADISVPNIFYFKEKKTLTEHWSKDVSVSHQDTKKTAMEEIIISSAVIFTIVF